MFRFILLLSIQLFFSVNLFSQKIEDNKIILPDSLIVELRDMAEKDQRIRHIFSNRRDKLTKKEMDSLWNLQDKIDFKNTLRLIEITKTYGYISSSNTNVKFPSHAVFMHTPEKLKKVVSRLIDNQHELGNVGSFYGWIKWHLNGRNELDINDFLKPNDTLD